MAIHAVEKKHNNFSFICGNCYTQSIPTCRAVSLLYVSQLFIMKAKSQEK